MDKEQQQIQFMSFIGILKESIKIISSRPKLFAKIALFFILPFNFFMLVSIATIKLITSNEDINLYTSRLIIFYLVQAVLLIIAFTFSLLSISTVVYSASCIFTSEEITFQKALSVALKVWKRLAFTMVSQTLLINTFVTAIIGICSGTFGAITFGLPYKQSDVQFEIKMLIRVVFIILLLLFEVIVLILVIISWQLANIITVMDDNSGFKAMKKSRELIKGNYGTAITMLLVLSLCCTPMFVLAKQLLVRIDSNFEVGPVILYGIISLVFNPVIMLFCLVVRTMFYFVCKSYHHESIDISSFTDSLNSSKSDGDYVPLENESGKIDQLGV